MKKYLKITLILVTFALLSSTGFSQTPSSSSAKSGNGVNNPVVKKVEQPTPVIVKTNKGKQRAQSKGNNTLTAKQSSTPIKKQEVTRSSTNSSEKAKVNTATPGATIKVASKNTSNATLTKTSVNTEDAFEKFRLAKAKLEKERTDNIITQEEYEEKLKKLKASELYLKKMKE